MSKKLRLSVDRLTVESFAVPAEEPRTGTVAGYLTRRDAETCAGPTCIEASHCGAITCFFNPC